MNTRLKYIFAFASPDTVERYFTAVLTEYDSLGNFSTRSQLWNHMRELHHLRQSHMPTQLNDQEETH
jgi:hypothetical protein